MRNIITTVIFAIAAFTRVQAQHIASWKITDVQQYSDQTDSVLVVNFWATFCKPCVEEIPYMERIGKKYEQYKVRLLLVSLDLPSFYPDKIMAFAQKNHYKSQVVWLNETNADYFCPEIDKSWSGVIPSTLIINKKTGYKKFIEAQMTPKEFEKELQKALGI